MPTQFRLPTPPRGAEEINAEVAIMREGGQVAYFAAGVPVFVHAEDDPVGRRVAVAQLLELGLAQPHELSTALRVNRSTLYRQQRKLKRHGVLGVVAEKRGPRGPHRFTADKHPRVARLLAEGTSIRQAAQTVGVSEGTIRHALRRGELRAAEPRPAGSLEGPRARSER